jgi:hypothetical protein
MLRATERALSGIERRVEQGTLSGRDQIGLAAGAVWNRFRMGKHFELEITDERFGFHGKHEQIEREAALDGIYVLRTTVPQQTLAAARSCAPASSSKRSNASSARSCARARGRARRSPSAPPRS